MPSSASIPFIDSILDRHPPTCPSNRRGPPDIVSYHRSGVQPRAGTVAVGALLSRIASATDPSWRSMCELLVDMAWVLRKRSTALSSHGWRCPLVRQPQSV